MGKKCKLYHVSWNAELNSKIRTNTTSNSHFEVTHCTSVKRSSSDYTGF